MDIQHQRCSSYYIQIIQHSLGFDWLDQNGGCPKRQPQKRRTSVAKSVAASDIGWNQNRKWEHANQRLPLDMYLLVRLRSIRRICRRRFLNVPSNLNSNAGNAALWSEATRLPRNLAAQALHCCMGGQQNMHKLSISHHNYSTSFSQAESGIKGFMLRS